MTPESTILLATRNAGKLREVRSLCERYLGGAPVLTLDEAGVAPAPDEARIERFDTFEENALAKARFFQERVADPSWLILAEDSGLCVDALGGAPGIRSKRFSGVTGEGLDSANNRLLLERISGAHGSARSARYRAVAVIIGGWLDTTLLSSGECEGTIAERPRGSGGFGYDPVFIPAGLDETMAELPLEQKQRISHRRDALQMLFEELRELDHVG